MSNVPVIVDDREPSWIPDRLNTYSCNAVVSRLDAGDYCFYPHGLSAAIERKTICDLLGSMASKRLVAQAHKMIDSYDIAILLREGQFRRSMGGSVEYQQGTNWVESGWAWSSFQGIMFDLWLMGFIVWDCVQDVAQDIASIIHSLSKEEHKWIKERERPSVLTVSRQYRNAIWAGCAFDSIGPETMEALIKGRSFAEVIRLAADDPKALTAVAGFGPKRAAKLHEEVTNVYG